MILILPTFLRLIAGKYVNAMAVYPFIIVRNQEVKESEVTIHHEKIHFRQQLELFIVPFYILYILFYIVYRFKGYNHFNAYMSIPFEREAYWNDTNLDYLKTRSFWAWINYL